MALIHNIEISPQKEEKLQEYLFTEIKNQAKWRNNRSDTVNDQTKFYESYFGKSSFIDKSILNKFLKESEKFHTQNLNYNITNKTKFLEITRVNSEFNSDNYDKLNQILFSFDNDDKELQIFEFSLGEKKESDLGIDKEDKDNSDIDLEFYDFNSFKINVDTNVKVLKKSQSRYFLKSDSDANIFMMDMYSLYQLAYNSANTEDSNEALNFSKILTLDLTPNKFMSNFYLDRFFIINGDSVKLFDNNFLLVNGKNFNHNNNLINFNSKLSTIETMNSIYFNPRIVFNDIKNYSLLNNQISNFKSTLGASSYNINPNFNLKNINNIFNKCKQTGINNNLYSNLPSNHEAENSIGNNTKMRVYEKGSFVGNPNLIMLSNKETVGLCDFRVSIFL